jgi:hypothetical protein
MVRPGTTQLVDPAEAAKAIAGELPSTVSSERSVFILDLSGRLLTPAALWELIVPLARRVRAGVHGDSRLVIVSADPATREIVQSLAITHDLAIFVAEGPDLDSIREASPAGDITRTEWETLDHLRQSGRPMTVSSLALQLGMEATAVSNRLTNLERKGYLYRVTRNRRAGDFFFDPRIPNDSISWSDFEDLASQRGNLASTKADPYASGPLFLTGEAAATAAEILARRSNRR